MKNLGIDDVVNDMLCRMISFDLYSKDRNNTNRHLLYGKTHGAIDLIVKLTVNALSDIRFCRRIIYAFSVDNYPYRTLSALRQVSIRKIEIVLYSFKRIYSGKSNINLLKL